jgi:hypothetical protein
LMITVIIAYSVINFIIQSIIQPKVTADAVSLSLTLTFLSLVFWSFVIGPIGAVLAVPLTLLVKALLLDVDPEHQVDIQPVFRWPCTTRRRRRQQVRSRIRGVPGSRRVGGERASTPFLRRSSEARLTRCVNTRTGRKSISDGHRSGTTPDPAARTAAR